ncbi:hypothetical protein [Mucilaginibacter sp. SP1R1]|uniref:hypothetical protein n=1 Tax=Mucilaginibacter sp. SP1R1 TaxID=2723091 RepID=UPI0016085F3B|nr:hypothetical protein [Mucilaginibacter sp. SP1R1]MBB6150767.1 hypothetical protein [Mucilaginibacter sp. SP1R1]
MKQYPKLIILMFACIAIGYSACTKSSVTVHNSSTVSPKVVSSQVAVNLKQVLYGEYGSFSIADGIDPSNLTWLLRGTTSKYNQPRGMNAGLKLTRQRSWILT